MNIPELQAPSKNTEDTQKQNKGSGVLLLILAGIIICLILIIMFLLPSLNFEKDKIIQDTVKSIIKNSNINEEALLNNNLFENKDSFNENNQIEWLMLKTDAEKNNMNLWATKDYKQAIEIAKQAEHYKQEQKYRQAEKYFTQASAIVNKAFSLKNRKIDEMLESAQAAIEKEELEQAKKLIETAILIVPDDEKIKKIQKAFKNRYEVKQLYKQAVENIKDNKNDVAILNFEQALLIEPDNEKIKEELKNLKETQKQSELDLLINKILSAIENNKLNKAKKLVAKAKTIKQNEPTIWELEKRISEKSKDQAISFLSTQAERQESKEQWYKALTDIEKIIVIDPDTYGVKSSRLRVQTYIKIILKLENIINNQQSLQSDEILQQSINTLDEIRLELKQKHKLLHPLNKTPKLQEKIALAEKIVKQASMKIQVTIVSDNETDIVIYKIGKIGKLKQKQIILRPGIYTFVGSRAGYRDIRKKIKIKHDAISLKIRLQCQEKI